MPPHARAGGVQWRSWVRRGMLRLYGCALIGLWSFCQAAVEPALADESVFKLDQKRLIAALDPRLTEPEQVSRVIIILREMSELWWKARHGEIEGAPRAFMQNGKLRFLIRFIVRGAAHGEGNTRSLDVVRRGVELAGGIEAQSFSSRVIRVALVMAGSEDEEDLVACVGLASKESEVPPDFLALVFDVLGDRCPPRLTPQLIRSLASNVSTYNLGARAVRLPLREAARARLIGLGVPLEETQQPGEALFGPGVISVPAWHVEPAKLAAVVERWIRSSQAAEVDGAIETFRQLDWPPLRALGAGLVADESLPDAIRVRLRVALSEHAAGSGVGTR